MNKTTTMNRNVRVLALLSLLMTLLFAGTISVFAASGTKPKKITTSKKTITTTVGSEFELKVKMTPSYAEDDYLQWSIVSGKAYVAFADNDLNDDEIELKAIKAGTAKVRCKIRGTTKKLTFTVKVKAAEQKIKAKGATTRTVEVGDDFELEVTRYSGLKERYLKWTIKDTSIVAFEDKDRTGDDIDLVAKKAGTTTVTCTNTKKNQKVTFTITVKAAEPTIKAKGELKRTVKLRDDFELEVKKYAGLKDRYLKWTIKDTSIVRFDDDERTGDEVEFYAKKVGTTTITCTNTKTNQKITFTITVVKK